MSNPVIVECWADQSDITNLASDSGLRSALSDHIPRMVIPRHLGTASGNEVRYSSGSENEACACILPVKPSLYLLQYTLNSLA
jgi:hypothetical protein